MLRSCIQIIATILTITASYFLIKANFGLTPTTIAKLSCTIQGWFNWSTANKEAVAMLAKQSAYTQSGFILLVIAFLLQMIGLWLPMRIHDFGGVNLQSILISLGCCAVIILITYWYSNNLSDKITKDSLDIIEKMLNSKEIGK